MFAGGGYIRPTRTKGERYYRYQELAVDQVEPGGENLAMFLNSLSKDRQKQFSDWVEKLIGYSVSLKGETGHVSIMLSEKGDHRKYNITDMGYGFSQILPVMAQLWVFADTRRRTFPRYRNAPRFLVMEQPELHLHPSFQAKIADSLLASKNRMRESNGFTIVETHSQAIVNRLGDLVADGSLDPEDVAIYVFDRPGPKTGTQITRAHFDEQGSLINWPYGFFSSGA
jgi:predicted ATPase